MVGLLDCNNFFVSCERVVDPSLVGKAVAVLSNNDGCCISRSNEFKALGIAMGTPYFQLKDREARGEVVFRSSNHELYGKISHHVMSILQQEAVLVEQYSIDEAFLHPPMLKGDSLMNYGLALKKRIWDEAGIPCGIGFAKTKTLAKLANHIGKKLPSGIFTMPSDETQILEATPVSEVWGIGRRFSVKLRSWGIRTARELRDLPDNRVREFGGVGAVRTVEELRGKPCLEENDYSTTPDSISCSRTFAERVVTCDGLCETIASFAAQAAVKLRRHKLFVSGCNIFAQYGPTLERSFVARTVVFPFPLRDTNDIVKALRPAAETLFMPGASYRKSGVTFFGLEKTNRPGQQDLFALPPSTQSPLLYETLDRLNSTPGLCRIGTASEGVGSPTWKMRQEKLSNDIDIQQASDLAQSSK